MGEKKCKSGSFAVLRMTNCWREALSSSGRAFLGRDFLDREFYGARFPVLCGLAKHRVSGLVEDRRDTV
jgi:hypothetical protein